MRTQAKTLVALELLKKAVELPHPAQSLLRPALLGDNCFDFNSNRIDVLGMVREPYER